MTRPRILNKFCVKLLSKTRKDFFSNLNVKRVTYSKQLWKASEPHITDRTLKGERIKLIENEKVLSDERQLVKIFNKYFSNIVSNATRSYNIPIKIAKENSNAFATFITESFNNMIGNSVFLDLLKKGDITLKRFQE